MVAERYEIPLIFSTDRGRYFAVLAEGVNCEPGLSLLLPGSGAGNVDGQIGPNRFMLQLAEGLARRGLRTARFAKLPLDARMQQAKNYEEEYLEPVIAMLEELAARGRWQVEPLILIGHSLGGHVAPQVAAHLDEVCAIALLNAPFDNMVRMANRQVNMLEPYLRAQYSNLRQALEKTETVESASELNEATTSYFYMAKQYKVQDSLMGLRVPFMCITCGKDAHVPASQADKWIAAFDEAEIQATHQIYPGLNHLCIESMSTSNNAGSLEGVLLPGKIADYLLDDLAAWCITRLRIECDRKALNL